MRNNRSKLWMIILILCSIFLFPSCSADTKENNESIDITNTVPVEITKTAQSSSTPTSEPTSTSASESQISDDELAENLEYLTIEEEKMIECSSALNTMAASFTEVGNDVSLLLDPTYLAKLNAEIDDFETYCTNMGQENPPSAMEAVNDYLLLADDEYQQGADDMRYGINNLDADHLNTAADHLTIGSTYINLATDELNTILDSLQSE